MERDALKAARDALDAAPVPTGGRQAYIDGNIYREATPGYIYGVVHPKFPGYTKIGRTNNVSRRLTSYNTGCPERRYEIAFAIECQDAFATEIEAHTRLDGFRMAGTEWFAVHPTDAHHIIEALIREDK